MSFFSKILSIFNSPTDESPSSDDFDPWSIPSAPPLLEDRCSVTMRFNMKVSGGLSKDVLNFHLSRLSSSYLGSTYGKDYYLTLLVAYLLEGRRPIVEGDSYVWDAHINARLSLGIQLPAHAPESFSPATMVYSYESGSNNVHIVVNFDGGQNDRPVQHLDTLFKYQNSKMKSRIFELCKIFNIRVFRIDHKWVIYPNFAP